MPEPKLKTIDGTQFLISQPYEPGHVINEAEARALNQTRSENVGNNVRAKLKEMKEANESEQALADYVASYDAEYILTLGAVSATRKLDPVEKEAQRIARELLKNHLAETGRKLTVAPEGETEESWKEKVQEQVDSIAENEEVIKIAKKNVEAKKKQADALAGALEGVKLS